ncbi:3-phosphoglycerate dehydrogenase family protein [Ruminococcus sp.]|uniref:3-phosphoglycerate dehydrogenase family protein n=1 Tax=Ruminococcus sp. TaxID=41978 RepID=UPI0025CE00EE|nr:3-phosphoglycerate dehydrogenase family protein [Ruminococcus sp.]MBR1432735.1 3-phosphoglycerate dehydrogenase [Ruminococcus sp.]HOA00302.1 3-phosphoglycerate dehydrogenase family protein [Ruminococcus sp.]HOH85987.1 3-phosphoglycerate dehydrogenase family protein [Ruminococcus sp.]
MYNIQTLNKISAVGTDVFDKSKYAVAEEIANPDAIMVRSAKMHDMQFGDNLLAIARAGAGVNNIPVERCAQEGICVFNTPGANSNAVKELAVCALLLASRKIVEAASWAASLKGTPDAPKTVEGGKSKFAGPEIAGKTLGIIGLGAIGGKIANAAEALGMKVIGYDPYISIGAALHLDPTVKIVSDINDIYANSDYITIHMPYTPQTKNTIDAEQIAMMKDGVRLINLARGELINSEAVVKAIADGKVAKYVTDFADDVVLGVENVIVLPHLGASTPESEDNCAVMAAEELIEYLENGNIKNSVNLPNASMNAVGTKICIIHKNVPTTIASITTAVGNEGLNIENMVNASKKDFAYTMLDIIGDVPPTVEGKINAVDGVIRVRIIK